MILKNQIRWIFLILICVNGSKTIYADGTRTDSNDHTYFQNSSRRITGQLTDDDHIRILDKLNSDFQASITYGDTAKSRLLLNSILKYLSDHNSDKLTTSNSQYYIGVYYLLSGENSEAIIWFRLSTSIREQVKCYDEIYAKCLFNMGIAYNNLGDFKRMEQFILSSLEIETKLYGESSPLLLRSFSALVTAYLNLNDYSKAISYGNRALKLIGISDENYNSDIAILYTNIGVSHARLSDYSKAVLFLEQAESIYKKNSLSEDENYINLLNSLAVTYFFLGLNDRSDEYFNKGLQKIKSSKSAMSLNFLNSFAVTLGNAGKVIKGETLIAGALAKAESYYGHGSRDYYEVLKNYAEYLRIFKINLKKSLLLYEQCIEYLDNHKEDKSLKDPVNLGYALALSENGESEKALEIVQKLLVSGIPGRIFNSPVKNPEINLIEPTMWSIKLLKAKYRILWDIYRKQKSSDYLFAASETSELIIALLDKVRINISEDESRLILGDRFRDSYLYAIRDFDLCYKITGNSAFLDKAFEYSEKSKVAGLLASTRELKATQFHIPADIAELERRLKTEISFYNARISEENFKRSPDVSMISEWKGLVINATQQRDSLIDLFEKQYPEYYLIKYNTGVIKPGNLPDIAGRNTNYLSYVVSDTVLYIFLTNRKHIQLVTVQIDSGFFSIIREFRNLLSLPQNDAKSNFIRYTTIGSNIYKIIIEPVRKYFISNKLLISPDNILSYIPFEAIPMRQVSEENLLYNEIPYLMNDFRISYTYSATFLAESLKKDKSLTNSLVAFAPVYTGSINVDSLLGNRQAGIKVLQDLPFARMEAEFVTDLTGGKLFINNGAKESVFKSEAGKYDIVHLAMHTVLNDQYPMHSKMLFYQEKDSVEDGNLNTYEVYGVPLKAKMVILSSCNTGTGIQHSGEGILSLARGFVSAGSQSVIMSMWEIEDRSGTEIVKSFYRYLKRGATKSNALRKARIDYLKNADMLRSHPYFWSSLVIYGNNAPLYYSFKLALIIGLIFLLVCAVLILNYFKSRKS
jgi:CHAT domain-containing protein